LPLDYQRETIYKTVFQSSKYSKSLIQFYRLVMEC